MRIACIYLPSFPLQVAVRAAPHLTGAAVAVADEHGIVAASRAAIERGVRAGIAVSRARELAADLTVIARDAAADRAAVLALADALLQCSPVVDLGADRAGTHKALFVEVPRGSRGATFGDKLAAAAGRQGFRARVGIADDRFTAWCAAALPRRATASSSGADVYTGEAQASLFGATCTTVPRGGSAAFLAPLPLSLLPIEDDVRHLLEGRGIRTIGDFAALPPPTVGRRYSHAGVDLHELARGEGPSGLVPYVARDAVVERLTLEEPADEVAPVAFVLRPVVERVCERLRGRGRAASGVALRLIDDAGAAPEIAVKLPSPTSATRAVLDAVRARLIAARLQYPAVAVELTVVADAEPEADELDLFAARHHRRTRRGKRGRRRSRQPALPLALD